MPETRADEEYGEYMNRCIPQVYNEEEVDTVDEAIARCNSYWEQSKKENKK